jgi:hypothetical protein
MCYPLSAGWLSWAALAMLLPKQWHPAYPSSDGACKPYHTPNNAHLINRAVIGAIGVIVGLLRG